ncbi:MAG: M23 family metallopeptidase, partial [Candidatus Hydrogenedentota bacterium]
YLYIFFHLEKFGNDSLNKYLREIGGEDIDLWFKNAIRVNAGEIVGYSGESGSGLPHLHFELRTDFDTTVNPLQLIKIQDKQSNFIVESLIVYPVGIGSLAFGKADPVEVLVSPDRPLRYAEILFKGEIGMGVKCKFQTSRGDSLSPYEWGIKLDDTKIFKQRFDYISYYDNTKSARIYDATKSTFGPTFYSLYLFNREARPVTFNSNNEWNGIIDESFTESRIFITDYLDNTYEIHVKFINNENIDFDFNKDYTIEGWDDIFLIKSKYKGEKTYKWIDVKELESGVHKLEINNKRLDEVYLVVIDEKQNEFFIDTNFSIKVPGDSVFKKTGIIINRDRAKKELAGMIVKDYGYQTKQVYDFKKEIKLKIKYKEKRGEHLCVFSYDWKKKKAGFYKAIEKNAQEVDVRYLKSFVIADDIKKPYIGKGYYKTKEIYCIESYDRESGIDEDSIIVTAGKMKIPSEYDYDRNLILCNLKNITDIDRLNVSLKDRAGNILRKNVMIKN